jgi:protein-disulfide isomerase
MTFSRALSLLLLCASGLAALAACSAPDPAVTPGRPARQAAAPSAGGDEIVAEVNGQAITRAQLDERAASALTRIRQEEYEALSRALDELIADRLLETEAEARGMSRAELYRQEVTQRVTPPASAYVAALYEQNLSRFAGQPREEALARIEEVLLDRATVDRQRQFAGSLREEAEVTVHLDPPRVAIQIPAGSGGTGPEDAPVTIVEFSDYQCPFCHRAQGVVDRILEEYAGKVRFVHLDFPLDNHPGAIPAARASRCAGEQGRFWDYHRNLMLEKGPLDQADLDKRAASLGLDTGRFSECMASDRHDEAIINELEYGSSLGVTGTPAYFINGRMVSGARPYADFAEIIDAELAGD